MLKKPISLKTQIIQVNYGFFITAGPIIVLHLFTRYFSQFPYQIEVNIALEIQKTIIQADGFLIGLTGVIFAQILWTINHQQNAILQDIYKTPIINNDGLNSHIRKKQVKDFDSKRKSLVLSMFMVVGAFMLSIALSLSGMARTQLSTETIPTNPEIMNPLILLFLGIIVLVIVIATFEATPEDWD